MTHTEAKKRDMTENERRFWVQVSLEKSNYGPPQDSAWLKRQEGGVLVAMNPPTIKQHLVTLPMVTKGRKNG
jgi:RecA-family ATPase